MSPSCPDPQAVIPHVALPPRWAELKKLIEELMNAKSVVLGFNSTTAHSPDRRRHFRSDGLVYDRLLSTGLRPEIMVFNYEYGRGDLEASESIPGFEHAYKAGSFESSYLEAVHHERKFTATPFSTDNFKRGQSNVEFQKLREEVFRVHRLFAEVLPAIDPGFGQRFSAALAGIRKEIEQYWVYRATVRSDVWLVPIGALVKYPGISSTISFDMTADKLRKLRELTGMGNVDLPVVLFNVGQPTDPNQRSKVLADERLLQQLAAKLQEVQQRDGTRSFLVCGYADGSGRADGNKKLAAIRADWVIRRLRENGVKINLKPEGCGDRHARARTGIKLNTMQRAVLLVAE